jgi:GcrA cell cycle regulator
MSGFWTMDAKRQAAEIWNNGGSASDIAKVFGVSRNSAIGIVHRNRGLFKTKPRQVKQARLPKPEKMFRPKLVKAAPRAAALRVVATVTAELHEMFEAAEPVVEAVETSFSPIRPIPFLKVTDATCRWPLWTLPDNPGGEGLCCGDPTDGNSSWCSYHRKRARAQ